MLWNVSEPWKPRLLGRFDNPGGAVNDVTFSSDGNILFAASADGNVWGWNVSREDKPTSLGRPLAGHRGPVYDLTNIGDHVIATSGKTARSTSGTFPTHTNPTGSRGHHLLRPILETNAATT
jgi:WD40 repeat protein